jgi:signal transduction histidine kinase
MKILIEIKSVEGRSFVNIKDNAGGIPEDIIENIFDLYMSTKVDGSGLGLNIAKSVIETNMNGKIHVKNIKDGAEFSIIL